MAELNDTINDIIAKAKREIDAAVNASFNAHLKGIHIGSGGKPQDTRSSEGASKDTREQLDEAVLDIIRKTSDLKSREVQEQLSSRFSTEAVKDSVFRLRKKGRIIGTGERALMTYKIGMSSAKRSRRKGKMSAATKKKLSIAATKRWVAKKK